MASRRDLTIKPRKTKAKKPRPAEQELFQPEKPPKEKPKKDKSPKAEATLKPQESAATETPAADKKPTRKRRHGRSLWRIVLRVAVAVLAVVVVIWGVYNWENIAPDSLLIWLDETLGGGHRGDGYPVELPGDEVRYMTETSEGLVLVTDTAYRLFNSTGGEVLDRPHGYSEPTLKTAGKWALLYDAGSYRLRLESRADTAYERTLKEPIVDGTVNAEGMVALVTGSSQGYLSEVTVYDRRQEQIYRWYSSELHVLSVALNEDSSSMAVIGVSSRDGYLRSSLLLFDFKKSEPTARYDDTGVLLTEVAYFPGGTVAAIGDTEAWIVNQSGTVYQQHAYTGYQLVGTAVGETSAGLVLQAYGSADHYRLMVLNPSGDLAYTADVHGTFRDVSATENGLLLLTAGKLYVTDPNGITETLEVIRDGRLVGTLGDQRMVLGLMSLNAY